MKRKIAALMAADIAEYSRLVAEDEEETLRRLSSYRSFIDDFIARASGRIFNTAGDAVLAEFPSAVEAVRCAIDIQESVRTRNLAYPPSRHMKFRIGITVGDVVERKGDLLGDAVNIAARLEGLAEPGGICVSRTVYEQVANKLSVQFADIGEQQVKNIPTPIHVYRVAVSGTTGISQALRREKRPNLQLWIGAVVTALILAVFGGSWLLQSRQSGTPSSSQVMGTSPNSVTPHATVLQDALPAVPLPKVTASTEQPIEETKAPVSPVQITVPRINEANVRALAANQNIPLPQSIQILKPSAGVPQQIIEYLGAYGGEQRWGGNGRQTMLIVRGGDSSGAVFGFYALGPPNPHTFDQSPAQYLAYEGRITENGLTFEAFGGRWKYQFKLRPGGVMIGRADGPKDSHPSVVIERLN